MRELWQYYNPNPCGRMVGDCSVRAVSCALEISWERAYALIAESGFQMCDVMSSNSVWGAVLRRAGFSRYAIESECPDCYTAEDFCIDHPYGVYVLGFGNHVATVKSGILMDSWCSLKEIPQYYWHKEE